MFNEKTKERGKNGNEIPVFRTPKYEESRAKAIAIIEKYESLTEGDFWILMRENRAGTTMIYSGLIISHNGCLKLNDESEDKFDPQYVHIDKEGFVNGNGRALVVTYQAPDLFEVGEVNASNCKNDYPYAMAYKRCFDRVVLKKTKLAYAGIYSDSEADEFAEKVEDEKPMTEEDRFKNAYPPRNEILEYLNANISKENLALALNAYKVGSLEELDDVKLVVVYNSQKRKESA